MLFNTLAASILVTAALSVADNQVRAPGMPYKLEKLAKMSLNEAFGLLSRQNSGYAPTQTYCNAGNDCPTACGADTVQCPSTDGNLHCFTPNTGQQCCPDGAGNACDKGFFCSDNSSGTWCCPEGTSLSDCAALYGVSSLTSIAFSTTSSPAGVSTTPLPVSASTSSASVAVVTPPTSSNTAALTSALPTYTKPSNGTVTSSSVPLQITGAANKLALGALPALALAAGAVLAL